MSRARTTSGAAGPAATPAAVVEVHGGIEPIAQEWDELAEQTNAAPFLRPAWVSAWQTAFGRGELLVFGLREAGRLTAVLPMTRTSGRLRSPTNWHTPQFGAVATGAAAAEELATGIFGRPERSVDIAFLERGTESAAAERAARAAGRFVHVRTLANCPYIETTAGEDAYLASLSKSRRKGLRRRERRLHDAGVVEYRLAMCPAGAEIDAALDEAFRVEASGWKGRGGTAIASSPATARFYSEISRWAAERGWLRLSSVRLDGRAIAFDLSLEHDGAYYSLKAGYDADAAAYGPGFLLLHELVRWAHDADVTTIELLGGDEEYKRDWATGNRELVVVQGFSRSPAGRLARSTEIHGRPAAKAVKSAVRRVLP